MCVDRMNRILKDIAIGTKLKKPAQLTKLGVHAEKNDVNAERKG